MLSMEVYRLIHLFGNFVIIFVLGGVTLHRLNGGDRNYSRRRLVAIMHGIGMFLSLLGAFGLQARLGIGWPGWFIAKIFIWLFLGAALALVYRLPGKFFWWGLPLVVLVAIYLATFKPF
ncbi:MAG: hypothetical protein KDK30_09955 [Leptospiraceae bacterium]|nr:hypothetical protein [Leptospiraceae bacterium]MCB1316691.1 hypothetical protein [Leptospiraceae bacterium]